MTATTVPARHASLPDRVSAELTWRLAQHTWRLGWDAAELAAHQRQRLRMLLAYAAEFSPFHARRLRGLDLSRFEAGDLAGLPVMTKAQMGNDQADSVSARAGSAGGVRGPVSMTCSLMWRSGAGSVSTWRGCWRRGSGTRR